MASRTFLNSNHLSKVLSSQTYCLISWRKHLHPLIFWLQAPNRGVLNRPRWDYRSWPRPIATNHIACWIHGVASNVSLRSQSFAAQVFFWPLKWDRFETSSERTIEVATPPPLLASIDDVDQRCPPAGGNRWPWAYVAAKRRWSFPWSPRPCRKKVWKIDPGDMDIDPPWKSRDLDAVGWSSEMVFTCFYWSELWIHQRKGLYLVWRGAEAYRNLEHLNEAGRMILQRTMAKRGDKGASLISCEWFCFSASLKWSHRLWSFVRSQLTSCSPVFIFLLSVTLVFIFCLQTAAAKHQGRRWVGWTSWWPRCGPTSTKPWSSSWPTTWSPRSRHAIFRRRWRMGVAVVDLCVKWGCDILLISYFFKVPGEKFSIFKM